MTGEGAAQRRAPAPTGSNSIDNALTSRSLMPARVDAAPGRPGR
jgi:hypothetical protein